MKQKKIFAISLSIASYVNGGMRDVTISRHTGSFYAGDNGSTRSYFNVTDASWRRAQRAQLALLKSIKRWR